MEMETLLRHRGGTVIDVDGNKIGSLEEIYLDDATGDPAWALVNTGMFGTKASFVPLQGASSDGDDLMVRFAKDKVKDAPGLDAGQHLDASEEQELYRYYGISGESWDGADERADWDLGRNRDQDRPVLDSDRDLGYGDTTGRSTDDAMTRSEEELEVGKVQHETGRVRLRKHIVTDHVETTVPVQREEVRLEREPITDANIDAATSGPELSEDEHEVVLHAEEPVVDKKVVPRERVRLDKDVVTDEQRLDEDVRREEIVLDDQQDHIRR